MGGREGRPAQASTAASCFPPRRDPCSNLEGLRLGIEGKASLWRALRALAAIGRAPGGRRSGPVARPGGPAGRGGRAAAAAGSGCCVRRPGRGLSPVCEHRKNLREGRGSPANFYRVPDNGAAARRPQMTHRRTFPLLIRRLPGISRAPLGGGHLRAGLVAGAPNVTARRRRPRGGAGPVHRHDRRRSIGSLSPTQKARTPAVDLAKTSDRRFSLTSDKYLNYVPLYNWTNPASLQLWVDRIFTAEAAEGRRSRADCRPPRGCRAQPRRRLRRGRGRGCGDDAEPYLRRTLSDVLEAGRHARSLPQLTAGSNGARDCLPQAPRRRLPASRALNIDRPRPPNRWAGGCWWTRRSIRPRGRTAV